MYGYFSPLWPYRYDCTGSEHTLQSCSYSYYSGCDNLNVDSAGVHCGISPGMLKHVLVPSQSHCSFSHPQRAYVLMANYDWLEGKQAMKEDWSIAVKACGQLFVSWMMKKPQWPADNLDTQSILVSASIYYYIIYWYINTLIPCVCLSVTSEISGTGYRSATLLSPTWRASPSASRWLLLKFT